MRHSLSQHREGRERASETPLILCAQVSGCLLMDAVSTSTVFHLTLLPLIRRKCTPSGSFSQCLSFSWAAFCFSYTPVPFPLSCSASFCILQLLLLPFLLLLLLLTLHILGHSLAFLSWHSFWVPQRLSWIMKNVTKCCLMKNCRATRWKNA